MTRFPHPPLPRLRLICGRKACGEELVFGFLDSVSCVSNRYKAERPKGARACIARQNRYAPAFAGP